MAGKLRMQTVQTLTSRVRQSLAPKPNWELQTFLRARDSTHAFIHCSTMSHLPFLTIVPDKDNTLTDGTLDPDSLRSSSDHTASAVSSTSATSNLMSTHPTRSRIPPYLRFPLVVILSTSLSVALYSYMPRLTGLQLSTASREINGVDEALARVGWRVAELGVAWWFGLDGEKAVLVHGQVIH